VAEAHRAWSRPVECGAADGSQPERWWAEHVQGRLEQRPPQKGVTLYCRHRLECVSPPQCSHAPTVAVTSPKVRPARPAPSSAPPTPPSHRHHHVQSPVENCTWIRTGIRSSTWMVAVVLHDYHPASGQCPGVVPAEPGRPRTGGDCWCWQSTGRPVGACGG
jgi:hypothetical protein